MRSASNEEIFAGRLPRSEERGIEDPSLHNDLHRKVYGVFGIPADLVSVELLMRVIDAAASTGATALISTPNLNYLIRSRSDPEAREALLISDLCPVDGMPIIWLARLLGVPVKERHPGADIFAKLRYRAIAGGRIKVFLFGGADGITEKVSSLINAESTGMTCVGAISPGFGSVEDMSSDQLLKAINTSGADLLAVFLSAAKGQSWLLKNHHRLQIPVRAQLGATINFQAGTVRRAPAFMREYGLEWLWRIKEEPYLWRRYAADGSKLLWLVVTSALPLAIRFTLDRHKQAHHQKLCILSSDGPERITLKLTGAATEQSVDVAIEKFSNATLADKDILLELTDVTVIDPRFFGLLLMLRKVLKSREKSLSIITNSQKIRRIFRLGGFEFLLTVPVNAAL